MTRLGDLVFSAVRSDYFGRPSYQTLLFQRGVHRIEYPIGSRSTNECSRRLKYHNANAAMLKL